MRKSIITLLLLASFIFPQTDSLNKSSWTTSGNLGINVNQISLSNWSQGGDNTLAWTIVTNMTANYLENGWNFKNSLKVAYGRTKLGDTEYRTNDNEIYLESVLSKILGWSIDPYLSNTVRTSVGNGFDYKANPVVQVAAIFDPGYITQSLGFQYKQSTFFTTRIGFAIQETLLTNTVSTLTIKKLWTRQRLLSLIPVWSPSPKEMFPLKIICCLQAN